MRVGLDVYSIIYILGIGRNVGRDNFRIKNIKKAELVRESGEVVVGKYEMAELERLRCEQKIQHANRRNIAVPV